MSNYKRYLTLLIISIAISLSGDQTVHAEEVQAPLIENRKIIQDKSSAVLEKSTIIQSTTQEIRNLESKKQTLAEQLESIKQQTATLQAKLVEKKAAAEAEKKRLEELKKMFVYIDKYASGSAGNLYTAGNCTWYAKSRRPDLPNNLGNANTWYSNARAQGWSVGLTPKKGAVATSTAGWLGHVAYVEGVSPDGLSVYISEMNAPIFNHVSRRTAHYTEFQYIYELN